MNGYMEKMKRPGSHFEGDIRELVKEYGHFNENKRKDFENGKKIELEIERGSNEFKESDVEKIQEIYDDFPFTDRGELEEIEEIYLLL